MRALQFRNGELAFSDDVPRPVPGHGEVLIKVALAGICSTDLEIVKGYFGFQGILGHEFVGVVEEVNAVDSAHASWMGKRVVSSINFASSDSKEYIEYGLEHHPHRRVLGILNCDGAMADYVCVPLSNLYEVDEAIPDRRAVFVEPLAAALRIAEQVQLSPSARCCVVGPGRLGMLVAKVLAQRGACVTAIGRSLESLELPRCWGLPTGFAESFPASSFDLVVDTTGSQQGLVEAIRLAKPLGTVVLKSTFEGLSQLSLTKVVVDEIRLLGSRCGPFAPSLRMLKSGDIDTDALIDAEYELAQGVEAFDRAGRRGVRKVLLNINS